MSDRPLMVTLIHGTYAPEAPWTQTGSPLRTALEAEGWVVESILWGAKNRVSHRRDGAAAVRAHVEAHDGFDHVLLGHSHGGTVALRAIDGDDSVVRGLVTLNTPFLNTLGRYARAFEGAVTLAAVAASLIPLGWGLKHGFGWWMLGAYVGIVLAVAVLVVGWEVLGVRVGLEGEALREPPLRTTPVYCLSTPDDEAYGGLAWLAASQNALVLTLSRSVLQSSAIGAVAALLVLAGLLSVPLVPWLPVVYLPWEAFTGEGLRLPAFLDTLAPSFAAGGGVALGALGRLIAVPLLSAVYYLGLFGLLGLVALVVLSGVVTLSQGRFGPFDGLFNRFLVTLVPLQVAHARYEEVAGDDTPLRHSATYDDPETIARVVEWIRGRLASEQRADERDDGRVERAAEPQAED